MIEWPPEKPEPGMVMVWRGDHTHYEYLSVPRILGEDDLDIDADGLSNYYTDAMAEAYEGEYDEE